MRSCLGARQAELLSSRCLHCQKPAKFPGQACGQPPLNPTVLRAYWAVSQPSPTPELPAAHSSPEARVRLQPRCPASDARSVCACDLTRPPLKEEVTLHPFLPFRTPA